MGKSEHDLRNALGVVLGWVRVLRQAHGPETLAEGLDAIYEAAERIHGLLEGGDAFSAPAGTASAQAVAEDRRPATDASPGEGVEPPVLRGVRVLVVDDEPEMRRVVGVMLGSAGADVLSAASAAEAFQAVCRDHPDVVVGDLSMPREDGFQFISRVRALRPDQGGGTPAVALTAYVEEPNRNRALRAGFDRFLSKPVEGHDLVQTVFALAEHGRDASAERRG